MQDSIEISVEKCRIGPITARYVAGDGFRDVETETDDGVRRVAVCGLDRSHSKDYKVAYASDPLLVVTTSRDAGMSHDELREFLEDKGLWLDTYRPVDIPESGGGWKPGFASSTEASERLGLIRSRIENLIERDMDMRGGENGLAAYIPV